MAQSVADIGDTAAQPDDWFAANSPVMPSNGNTGVTGGLPSGGGDGSGIAAPGGIPGGYAGGAQANIGQNPGTQGAAGMDAFGRAWMASGGRTVADLKAFVAAHPEYNVTLGGSKGDKVYGPDGQFWADAVISAGTGGNGASWQTGTGTGGGGGSSMGGGFGSFGDFAQAYGKDFQAPTAEQAAATPGYQFQMGEMVKGLDKSAAARGSLLAGGHNKDLLEHASGLAASTYSDTYNRALSDYMTNYNVFRNDKNDVWGRYNDLSGRGTQAASSATA